MGRRSRSPGAITRFTKPADPKTGWQRFRLTDPGVIEGGITASIVYSSLTEDAEKTQWITDDYGDNNYTTVGRGACNGRVWCKPLLNSLGQGVLLTDAFTLRVVIEFIAITGDDWSGGGDPEPWMAVGISGQAVADDIPSNNHLALSVDYTVRNASTQFDKPKIGYNAGVIADTETYHWSSVKGPDSDAFPTYYYADIRIGPDINNTTAVNTSINVRQYDANKDHFGPNQWKMFEPDDSESIQDTGPAYIFVALTPEGGNNIDLDAGDPVTTDFRVWYMVQNDNWIPSGNP